MLGYKKRIITWSILLLAIMSFQTFAGTTAESDFTRGMADFKLGNYHNAVKMFENARRKGLKNTALYYNIGSAYFKTKNYARAEIFFSALINQPKMKSLVEYNLGLIALKQNQFIKSQKYFTSIVNNSENEKIIYLARLQLPKTIIPPAKHYMFYLSATAGTNDNINFAPIGIGTEESGSFYNALISADYRFSGTRLNGWSTDAMFYTIRYGDTGNPNIPEGAFDQDQLNIGLKTAFVLGGWETQLKVGFDQSTFGPRDYQSIVKFEARTKYKLSNLNRIYFQYGYEDISSEDVIFDYIEGSRQKITSGFRHYDISSYSQIYYELELNDRNDFVSNAGNIFSYSPTRHTLRGQYTSLLTESWYVGGDLSYRISDYPANPSQDRQDERLKAIIFASYGFTKKTKLKFKFEYTDNSSTDNIYVYDQKIIGLSLSTLF